MLPLHKKSGRRVQSKQAVLEALAFMAKLHLTIQVLDLSPKVTVSDLNTFFSYCGTVEKIILERKEDQSQVAFVTFRQPYAFQTALLLNGATIVDRRVRISPSQNVTSLLISENMSNETKGATIVDRRVRTSPSQNVTSLLISENMSNETKRNDKRCVIPPLVQAVASKGFDQLNKLKEEFDQKYKLSEKGRMLNEHTRSAISAVEQTAEHVGEVIVNNEHFSAGALWVSGALDKASKCVAEIGSHSKNKKDPNSRKQK